MSLTQDLDKFVKNNQMNNKGALCVALVVTRHAKKRGLPLDAAELLTDGGGQVLGLGRSLVQAILAEYKIDRVLAEEGGRTSRGSVGNMQKYVGFLNQLKTKGSVDLNSIEKWWVERVKEHFTSKPFTLRFDTSKSLKNIIKDLLSQAEKRQAQNPGSTYAGTVLQHLVGAKLNILLKKSLPQHGASVSDEASGREADFIVEDVSIHVTVAPTEALIKKCQRNIDKAQRPMIITTSKGTIVAEALTDQLGIKDRVDVFEAEQFLAGNLYEIGKFEQTGRRTTAEQIIAEYNKIVQSCETDPGLLIEFS